ncbi:alpha/beta-hydrolase [Schizophyllum commune Loenen D]|nr:alpha/beta-hydrolase [Schizophyllum commune Loenen D]
MPQHALSCLLLLLLLNPGLLLSAADSRPLIDLGSANIRGVQVTDDVEFYGGVPFAEPPLGELRLRPPVLKASLPDGEHDARTSGPACLQSPAHINGTSEDCLTLDVYRPSGLLEPVPVMLWIYGGGFYIGGALQYNATLLVKQSIARGKPVVVVAVNYRLGPLGFPQGKEAEEDGVLNLGLLDVKVALEWVQANIGTFGGDRNKVTVFGLSAGSIIPNLLMLNETFPTLARAAILQSGYAASLPLKGATVNEAAWQSFVKGIPECASTTGSGASLACLRSLNDSNSLLANINPFDDAYGEQRYPFAPVIDGPGAVVPDMPSTLYVKGEFAKIPTISGNVLDEGTFFIPGLNASFTTDYISEYLCANFTLPPDDPAKIRSALDDFIAMYPDDPSEGCPYNSGNDTFGLDPGYKRLTSIIGDAYFHALRRKWGQIASASGAPTYAFLFAQPAAGDPPFMGVAHSSNVLYQFGTETAASPEDAALATSIMDYWLSFATSLDPNDGLGSQRPIWPAYSVENEVLLQLKADNITTVPDDFRRERLAFVVNKPAVFHH